MLQLTVIIITNALFAVCWCRHFLLIYVLLILLNRSWMWRKNPQFFRQLIFVIYFNDSISIHWIFTAAQQLNANSVLARASENRALFWLNEYTMLSRFGLCLTWSTYNDNLGSFFYNLLHRTSTEKAAVDDVCYLIGTLHWLSRRLVANFTSHHCEPTSADSREFECRI